VWQGSFSFSLSTHTVHLGYTGITGRRGAIGFNLR